jgi:hypothetical protein
MIRQSPNAPGMTVSSNARAAMRLVRSIRRHLPKMKAFMDMREWLHLHPDWSVADTAALG